MERGKVGSTGEESKSGAAGRVEARAIKHLPLKHAEKKTTRSEGGGVVRTERKKLHRFGSKKRGADRTSRLLEKGGG